MPRVSSRRSHSSASGPGYTSYIAVPQNQYDDEVYYVCDVKPCNSVFRRVSDCRRHKRMFHDKSGLKPCPVCGSLMRPDALKGHMKRHEDKDDKPWPCPNCEEGYSFRESLLKHRKKKHGYQPAQYRPRQMIVHEAGTSTIISQARGKESTTRIPGIDYESVRSHLLPELLRDPSGSEICEAQKPVHRAAIQTTAIQAPTWGPTSPYDGISHVPVPPLHVPLPDPVWGAPFEAHSPSGPHAYLAGGYHPDAYVPVASHISTTTINSISWYQATRPAPSPANWDYGTRLGQDVTRWPNVTSRHTESYDSSLETCFTNLALGSRQNQ